MKIRQWKQGESLPPEILVLKDHFSSMLKKRGTGLVTVVPLAESVIAGIGCIAFMKLSLLPDVINIQAAMPIIAENPSRPSIGGRYCIKLHKHRKKGRTAIRCLIDGLAAHQGVIGPRHINTAHVNEINFDYSFSESIHMTEYFTNKIITIVRRKVILHRRNDGDMVVLKEPSDSTDLIRLVTDHWQKTRHRFIRNKT